MRILIIGGGVMGEIVARSMLNKHIAKSKQIAIAEVIKERREYLQKEYSVKVTADPLSEASEAELILFCLKPQTCREVLMSLKGKIDKGALVVSIMAGVTLSSMQDLLNHKNIVRSMPNLSAQIGEGMTVWIADQSVPVLQCLLAKMVFQSFGQELQVEDERMLDAATAVSGTGPAYIFYVAEKLIEASNALGFNEKESLRMIRQTFQGAMDLWDETSFVPEKLRKMVTSEKGTTEAAINCFEKLEIGSDFKEAVNAAYDRAKELGREVSNPLTS